MNPMSPMRHEHLHRWRVMVCWYTVAVLSAMAVMATPAYPATATTTGNVVFHKYTSGRYMVWPGKFFIGPDDPNARESDLWFDTSPGAGSEWIDSSDTAFNGSISAAAAAAISENKPLHITGAIAITGNTDLSLVPEIDVIQGGSFSVSAGVTLTLPRNFHAGYVQVFSGAGTVAGLTERVTEWRGAKGDSSTDDTTAIVKTLAEGAGAVVKFLPTRTYIVNGALLRMYANTIVTGYGATLKLKAGSYTSGAYFLGNSTTISYNAGDAFTANLAIYGITIDGNLANVTTTSGTTGVHIYKVDGFRMQDVTVKDLAGDIGVGYGFITSMSNDVYVDRCYFGRTPRSNIYLWESRNCNITNSRFDGSHYRDCISVGGLNPTSYQTTTFSINNCWLRNTLASSTHGIRFTGNVVGFVDDVRISGYLADDGGGSGATATATVVGGVVTAVTPGAGGSSYETPPEVRINGGGGRIATATAVLTGDAVTSYVVTDGGSGYSDVSPPTVYVGSGTEGMYFVDTLTQRVVVSNVRVDNAQYGILVESNSPGGKRLEFNNLQVGLNATVRNGIRSLSSSATIKVDGGIIKTTNQPLYIAFADHSSVIGALFDGGDTNLFLAPESGGTAIFANNTITGNTNATRAMLVAGDAAAEPIIIGNTVEWNTVDEIYMDQGGYAFGNTPGAVVNGGTAQIDGLVTSSGAPATTPGSVGLINLDTAGDKVYFATGTGSSADWMELDVQPLAGTTGSIGGGALVAGACASGTATVTGATTDMTATASPSTYPGDGMYWTAHISSANTATVKICATVNGTPTASTYNVRVLQ